MFEARATYFVLDERTTGMNRDSTQLRFTRVEESFVKENRLKIVAVTSVGTFEVRRRMVKVTVRFMSIARMRAGTGGVEFVSSGQRLREVLKEIVDKYDLVNIILTENGEVRPWARVLVNGRSHQFLGGLDAALSDGDRVALIYPYTENF